MSKYIPVKQRMWFATHVQISVNLVPNGMVKLPIAEDGIVISPVLTQYVYIPDFAK